MISAALNRANRAHNRANEIEIKANRLDWPYVPADQRNTKRIDALRAKAEALRKRQRFEVHSLWFGQVNYASLDLSDPDKAALDINWGYTGAYDEGGRIEPDESLDFHFEWPIWYFNMHGAKEFRAIRQWLREIEAE